MFIPQWIHIIEKDQMEEFKISINIIILFIISGDGKKVNNGYREGIMRMIFPAFIFKK